MPLHFSAIETIILRTDANGKKLPFAIAFRKKNGAWVEAQGVTCSSTSGKLKTVTLVFPNGEVRTIKKLLIMKVNGERIYL